MTSELSSVTDQDDVIDSAEWHFRGDFPAGLPYENALTHLGMFVAWTINLQLLAVTAEADDDAAQVRLRAMTGQDFVQLRLQDQLLVADLRPEGLQFALAYYRSGRFLADYLTTFRPQYPTPYHVPADWDHYDKIAPVITAAWFRWRRYQTRRWWQFWIRW